MRYVDEMGSGAMIHIPSFIDIGSGIQKYSMCHVTSNKANSNLECAEEKFQTRGWVRGCEK
jgi:hypothetical protein